MQIEAGSGPNNHMERGIRRYRIRESHRAVDNKGKALEPAVYVARILRLKAGHFVFEKPFDGPDLADITMLFLRPNDTNWPEPGVDVEGLPEWTSQSLTMSKHISRWPDVRAIKVTLHGGQNTRLLSMDRLMAFRENANQAVLTRITSSPHFPAPQTTTAMSVAHASPSVHLSATPPPPNRSSPATSPQRLPAHKSSSSWRSPAGSSNCVPTARQVSALPTNARVSQPSRSSKHEREDCRTSQAPTTASITCDNSLLASAIRVGREARSRYYEDNLWAMVVDPTSKIKEESTKVDGDE